MTRKKEEEEEEEGNGWSTNGCMLKGIGTSRTSLRQVWGLHFLVCRPVKHVDLAGVKYKIRGLN